MLSIVVAEFLTGFFERGRDGGEDVLGLRLTRRVIGVQMRRMFAWMEASVSLELLNLFLEFKCLLFQLLTQSPEELAIRRDQSSRVRFTVRATQADGPFLCKRVKVCLREVDL